MIKAIYTKIVTMGEEEKYATSDNEDVLEANMIGFGDDPIESMINFYRGYQDENPEEEL